VLHNPVSIVRSGVKAVYRAPVRFFIHCALFYRNWYNGFTRRGPL